MRTPTTFPSQCNEIRDPVNAEKNSRKPLNGAKRMVIQLRQGPMVVIQSIGRRETETTDGRNKLNAAINASKGRR
jgi:hypothetical protein